MMKTLTMPGRRACVVLVTVLVGAGVLIRAQTPAPARVWLTVLSTTDLHGHILPVDYYTDKPDALGLAKVATLVRKARAENPNGTLLVDSGDTIQGTPLEYLHNKVNNTPVDPMMLVMSSLGYDAMTVGNHEYNFGLKVLNKARGEAKFPWLSANTYKTGTDETAYLPYVIKEIKGVRVGIFGMTTPAIPSWENKENYAGLEFRNPVSEARKWTAILRDRERADVVIAAVHLGVGEDLRTGERFPSEVKDEDLALEIAKAVPGIDLLLLGHTHRDVPSLVVNGVLITQADSWGRHLARADLYLEKNESGRWRVGTKEAHTMAITAATDVDPEIARLAEPYNKETLAWLNRPIGESASELTAADGYFRDTAILDLVQRVQMETGKADVSMVANFNSRARLPKGPLTVRDIAGLYIYENTLVVLQVTGRQLKEALEHSAKYFQSYVAGKTPADLIDPRVPGFNFDIAEGVTYDLDITKPVGQRILNLQFHGQPLSPTQTLRLATNNYRVNGGGGYTMYAGAPEVYRSSEEIRELIIDWVEAHHTVPPTPNNNWRLVASPN